MNYDYTEKPKMKLPLKGYFVALTLGCALALIGCEGQKQAEPKKEEAQMSTASPLEAKIRRFAPTEITADAARLGEGDRQSLDKIIQAAALMDPLFRRQVWSGNDALLKKL